MSSLKEGYKWMLVLRQVWRWESEVYNSTGQFYSSFMGLSNNFEMNDQMKVGSDSSLFIETLT